MVPIGSVPIPRNRTVCMYVCMYYKYVHVCVCVLNSWLHGRLGAGRLYCDPGHATDSRSVSVLASPETERRESLHFEPVHPPEITGYRNATQNQCLLLPSLFTLSAQSSLSLSIHSLRPSLLALSHTAPSGCGST